jgi:hypothetical protein
MGDDSDRLEDLAAGASQGVATTARLLLMAVACVSAVIAACGCGERLRVGSNRVAASARISSQATKSNGTRARGPASSGNYLESDRDKDNDDRERPLPQIERFDTLAPRDYGREALGAEREAIATKVRRYYAAVAAGDGNGACALLGLRLARGLAEGQGDKTCATALMRALAGQRAQLVADKVATMTIVDVRVEGNAGIVTVGFKAAPSGRIQVARERGAWKVNALLDTEST